MAEPKLVISGLGKTYHSDRGGTIALKGVDLEVGQNEFMALVGTSGCGKSTLLSIAAGLDSQDEGSISIDAEPIVAPGLDRGVVFQSYTLLPWLTTLGKNQMFGLAITWNGVTGAFGWSGVEKSLPAELHGPLAYVFGHRYVSHLNNAKEAQRFFQTDLIFGYLLLLGVLGLTTDQVMKFLGRRLFRYLEIR